VVEFLFQIYNKKIKMEERPLKKTTINNKEQRNCLACIENLKKFNLIFQLKTLEVTFY